MRDTNVSILCDGKPKKAQNIQNLVIGADIQIEGERGTKNGIKKVLDNKQNMPRNVACMVAKGGVTGWGQKKASHVSGNIS
jgi:hypothetical protein